jgi:hypothetical protein
MIGLAIVLGLIIVVYFATTLDIIKASEKLEEGKAIHLTDVFTPMQKDADEALKERWLSNFNQLLGESNSNKDDTD